MKQCKKELKYTHVVITSEQVGRGHPDKVADQVSDHILTEALEQDKNSRVAIESAIGKGILFITGEITTNANINIEKISRKVLNSIDVQYEDFEVIVNVSEQSPEINGKVDKKELCAGDQGLMYGYATSETKNLLPIPFVLASELIKTYEKKYASNNGDFKFDSKSQVSYDYSKKELININLSVQHSKKMTIDNLRIEMKKMILETISEFEKNNDINILPENLEIIINNGGSFILGGAFADAGLTGRKNIADTYGGWGRHGGGAFSGKDYTKVDRSASYYARYVATQFIKEGLSEIVEIQVSYIIGQAKPIVINVETFGTENESIERINEFMNKFDFKLQNIIKELDLKNIDYRKTTTLGHFGKKDFKWG